MNELEELRAKTEDELEAQLKKLKLESFQYRMQKGVDNFSQVHLVKKNRRNVAQIKTVLNEKKRCL